MGAEVYTGCNQLVIKGPYPEAAIGPAELMGKADLVTSLRVRRGLSIAHLYAFGAVLLLSTASALGGTIRIDGSSTVYPITDLAAAEFQRYRRDGTRVTIGISGTGGGFRKFCRGETDISNASRPILTAEMNECRASGVAYLELPVAFDAITVVVSTKNSFLNAISVDELRRLWAPAAEGRILRWNQLNAAWPNAPIKLYGPGSDSGTFDYFTEAIVGAARASRRDFVASEDDNVLVHGIAREAHALGYFGYSYYVANKQRLRALAVSAGQGAAAVHPSVEAVVKGQYQPLSRPIFIYVSAKSLGRNEVQEFVTFYLKNGTRFALEGKYVPLPDSAYGVVLEHVGTMRAGTVFQGVPEIGVTIEDLIRRETKH